MTPQERRHPGADQGLAAAADRAGVGHQRPGGQAADQAVRADAQGDAPGRAGPDARPRGAHAPGALSPAGDPLTSSPAMAVRLRLTRIGGRKNPIWRVVVADQRSKRDGRVIETVGHYNAQTEPSTIVLDEERVRDWLAAGRPADRHRAQAAAHPGHQPEARRGRREGAARVPGPRARRCARRRCR